MRATSKMIAIQKVAVGCALVILTSIGFHGAAAAQAKKDTTPPTGTGKPPVGTPPPDGKSTTDDSTNATHGRGKPINIDKYRLQPGDTIQIAVDNRSGYDGYFGVPASGKLLMPEIGELQLSGETIDSVRMHLQAALDKFYNNVVVHTQVREIHSRKAAIIGAVRLQGLMDMGMEELRLVEFLDAAGGLQPPINRPDAQVKDYVVTLQRDGVTVPINIVEALSHPGGPSDLVILPNDRIVVTLPLVARKYVHILGQVVKPGAYDLDENTTVLSLFQQCGYPLGSASLSHTYVIRNSTRIDLDIRPMLTGSTDQSKNKFKFEDGDIMFVPEVKTSFMVWGQVGRQGNYPFPEGGTVNILDAINAAGQLPAGDFQKVHLIRTGKDGKQSDQQIDVEKMVRKGIMKDNVPLMPNDVVWVGPKKHKWKPSLSDAYALFSPLVLLRSVGLNPF